jgi:hypothetical protein
VANTIQISPQLGRLTVLTGDQPIAEADAILTIPPGIHIRLCSVTIVCSRVSGAARIGIRIVRNADIITSTVCPANLGAGTWVLSAMAGSGTALSVHTIAVVMPLPEALILSPNDTITTVTAGMGIDDQYQALTLSGYVLPYMEP